jgi:RNA polymerase sigma-70 factor (ECF subfamily)
MDEPQLVRRFFERDESVLEEMREKYGAYCNRVAFSVLRDSEDAAECESDAYLQVWDSIPPNRPECFRTYLGRIVRNLAVNRLYHRSREKRGGPDGEILTEIGEILDSAPSPEEVVMQSETIKAVDAYLCSLPPKMRIVFVQRYWYYCSVEEIAILNQCSTAAVYTALSRVRTGLKEYLKKEGYL